jgi:glycosyltransferase involved in cell wall biosynthesis
VPVRPLVSVITPTLNQAHFLEPTLRSVRAQTYPRIEHIVIDGGSTDGTLDILRRLGGGGGEADGVLRWQSEPDRGMYDAINKGLALANGEILAYLNSDDAWLPWAVEAVVRVFESRPDVDLVFGDGIKVFEADGAQRLRLFPPFDRVSLANYESLMQPAVFWRGRLTERIGAFETGMRYVADLDYWLRAAEAGAKVAHLNEVIAIERIHEGRLSTAHRDAMAAEDQDMRARHTGGRGGPAGRQRAVRRYQRWQRLLWLTFVAAASVRSMPGPWHRFLRGGNVKVRRRKALNGSRPNRSRKLRNAVVSRLAADVLAGTGPGPGPAAPNPVQ